MRHSDTGARVRRTGRSGRRMTAIASAVLVGATLAPTPAYAAMETRPADDAAHDYCFTPGFTVAQRTTHTAMSAGLGDPTDMSVAFRGDCGADPRGNSTVDIWFKEATLGPNVRGETSCQVPVAVPGGFVCDTWDVKIDYAHIAAQGGPESENREKTLVHEIGHTVGLADHTHTPCAMQQGPITSRAVESRRFTASDIRLINANY